VGLEELAADSPGARGPHQPAIGLASLQFSANVVLCTILQSAHSQQLAEPQLSMRSDGCGSIGHGGGPQGVRPVGYSLLLSCCMRGKRREKLAQMHNIVDAIGSILTSTMRRQSIDRKHVMIYRGR
jgi:hypothetical protein